MKYRIPSVVFVAALIIGCSETQSGPTEVLTPNFDGASGCYTVESNVVGEPVPNAPWIIEGQITGDLVGSYVIEYDRGSLRFTGSIIRNTSTWYFTITGGIIPGLEEFQTRARQRNHLIDNPATPGTVAENHGTMRALSGVEKANLHFKGTYDVPSEQLDWDLQGVICP